MARKRGRDVVSELHEDARWSTWTNSILRWRVRGRPGRFSRRDVSVWTFMAAAVAAGAAVAGVIGLIVLLFRLL